MKKSVFIIYIAAIALLGCFRQDPVVVKSPVISIRVENDIPVTTLPGTDLNFSFSLTYKGGLKTAYATVDGEKIPGTERTFNDAPESTMLQFSYKPVDANAGNTLDFAVYAEGIDGAKGHYDYPVFILAAKPDIVITIPETAPNEFLVDGTTLSFDIPIKSGSVDMMKVTTYKGATILPEMSFPVEGDLRNCILPFQYTPTFGDTGGTTTFTIEVMDTNGNLVSANYSVKFYKQASTELNEYTDITMGLNRCPGAGQFFDAVSNKVYTANGVGAICADIDWAVFWSSNSGTQGLAFSAPAFTSLTLVYTEATVVDILWGTTDDILANWTTRNKTAFREIDIDADTYAGVSTRNEVIELFNEGTVPSKEYAVYQKKAGSTLAFKTARTEASSTGELEKYGLIRVTARPATNNTGTIIFDYKIEK